MVNIVFKMCGSQTGLLTSYSREVCVCAVSERYFRRDRDRAHHQCTTVRQHSVDQHPSAIQCQRCRCWFINKGGFTVHECRTIDHPPNLTILQSNVLLILVVTGLLDTLETRSSTNVYYKDQSQHLNNTELYSVNIVKDG